MNKLSTKVEMRFVVSEADWLPHDVRLRLARQQSGRMNNRGELVVTAQEFRRVFLSRIKHASAYSKIQCPSTTHKFPAFNLGGGIALFGHNIL